MSGTARSRNLELAYNWLLFQIRCTPLDETSCRKLYRPIRGDGIWTPARPCHLKPGHPDNNDCAFANDRYRFGLDGTGEAPLKELYGLAYEITDHGKAACELKLRYCETEMWVLRIVGGNRELWQR